MISDSQTNFVYFSALLRTMPRYSAFCERLTFILNHHEVKYGFLPNTNDIWCRDYMPIQVSGNKFIEYRYDPDYLLNKKDRKIKSYPDLVCAQLNLKTLKSDLIMDGGNVIKWEDKVIMTDKVIPENASRYRKAELIKIIENTFEVDLVILIPWLPGDLFGHADGMVRFIDGNTVLVDGYYKLKKSEHSKKLLSTFDKHKLNVEFTKFTVRQQSNKNWGYLNFLQMKDLLVIPVFNIEEDEQALEQFRKWYPLYYKSDQIKTIDATDIIRDGGVLNCISWNIVL